MYIVIITNGSNTVSTHLAHITTHVTKQTEVAIAHNIIDNSKESGVSSCGADHDVNVHDYIWLVYNSPGLHSRTVDDTCRLLCLYHHPQLCKVLTMNLLKYITLGIIAFFEHLLLMNEQLTFHPRSTILGQICVSLCVNTTKMVTANTQCMNIIHISIE